MSNETAEVNLSPKGCPFDHTNFTPARPALQHYEVLNEIRERAPILWNDAHGEGFFMLTRYAEVSEALQDTSAFNNDVIQAINPREDAIYFLPNMLNPPEHTDLRRVLNRWFSPSAVRKAAPMIRAHVNKLIDEIINDGHAEITSGFAMRYPTDLLLQILGMPVEDGPQMVAWVEAIFDGAFGGEGGHTSVKRIKEYFAKAIVDREANPRDPETDFVQFLMTVEINGKKISYEDQLTICMTMMTAGLDTTRSALGYVLLHLATHPDDRKRLIDDPSLIPYAMEEFVRLYNLIMQPGREVTNDIEFHGVEMKKGDVVWLGIAQACRDPREYEDPDEFRWDRENLGESVAWGFGYHRCIGMHLARYELQVAIEEWHKRIPDYWVAEGAELMERGVQLRLLSLPLEWPVPATS